MILDSEGGREIDEIKKVDGRSCQAILVSFTTNNNYLFWLVLISVVDMGVWWFSFNLILLMNGTENVFIYLHPFRKANIILEVPDLFLGLLFYMMGTQDNQTIIHYVIFNFYQCWWWMTH